MKCSQTGKYYTIKVKNLTRVNGDSLTTEDFKKGTNLIMEYKGKPYPAEYVRDAGMCCQLVAKIAYLRNVVYN